MSVIPASIPLQSGKRSYSLLRAIRSCLETGNDHPRDGLEGEIHTELARRLPEGRMARGFLVPADALIPQRRALDLSTGGGSVATAISLTAIDYMRSRLVLGALGATVGNFADSRGLLAMPKISETSTASWVQEGDPASQSNATINQVLFTPHTATAYTDLTRRLISSATLDFQDLVLIPELTSSIAHEIDRAALNGSGKANVPLGLLQNPTVPTISITGDTGDGAALAWADLVAIEQSISEYNADASPTASLGWVSSPSLRAKLRKTDRGTGSAGAAFLWSDGDRMLGRPAYASTSIPSDIAKGQGTNLSCLLYGDWSALTVNLFSVLDIRVNPYLQSTTGVVRISIFQDLDIAVRHPQAFATAVGASTT